MISLAGHKALITGSTQGVGRAIALAMAEAGADVVIHGLEVNDEAYRTIDRCRALGRRAELIDGDLCGETMSSISAVFSKATGAMANIDILVNNAGTCFDVPFLKTDFATFDKTMRLNVYAYYFLAQSFARLWVDRETAGRVLMIGSINGRLAERAHSAYDTSKGAVEMMVKTLCVDLAPHNIRVNGLAPGLFQTPLTARSLASPAKMRWMQMHTPNGQVPGPEVAGDAAVFLVSDAAEHIHGQMLLIDGGMSAWQQPDPE